MAGRVLECVGEQVRDDREQLLLVDVAGEVGRRLDDEPLLAQLGHAREALAAGAHQPRDVDLARLELQMPAVQARHLQQLFDALEQHVGVRADALDVSSLALAEIGRRE